MNHSLEFILTKKFLYKNYIIEKKTLVLLSKKLNISIPTIKKYITMYKIPLNGYKIKHGKYCKTRINKCLDCGKQISPLAKRCFMCKSKGKLNPMYKSKRTKNKNPNWKGGLTLKKYYCKYCNKKISRTTGRDGKQRCQKCYVKYHLLNKNFNFYKYIYNKKSFRSTFETNFAKWCDLSGIKWQYESKAFDLGNTTYTPDFYLPEFDCWIEIKGYWYKKGKNKFKKLSKIVNLIALEKKNLINMSILSY
jgi:hypothetical protein